MDYEEDALENIFGFEEPEENEVEIIEGNDEETENNTNQNAGNQEDSVRKRKIIRKPIPKLDSN
eukprot:jgi/Orpsp1_1/1181785/evm.model.c7180000078613.1